MTSGSARHSPHRLADVAVFPDRMAVGVSGVTLTAKTAQQSN